MHFPSILLAFGLLTSGLAQPIKPPAPAPALPPCVIFDRAAIEGSGATTLEEFLLTRTTANLSPPEAGSAASRKTSYPVILVDGKRLAPPDSDPRAGPASLKHIPLATVERVEVLTAAAGVTPGEGSAGIFNLVLRLPSPAKSRP